MCRKLIGLKATAVLCVVVLACNIFSKSYDPYKGKLDDLVPEKLKAGYINISLKNKRQLDKENFTKDFSNAVEGIKVEYMTEAGNVEIPVNLEVINFESKSSAGRTMSKLAQLLNFTQETKRKNGKSLSDRYVSKDRTMVVWTNGSLLCSLKSEFAQPTKNLEEALPF